MKGRSIIVEIVTNEQGTMAIWGFISKQVSHWVEMEIEMGAVKLDGKAVGKCSEIGTHTGAYC